MFVWLNKQGVRSDEGFEVQSVNRFKMKYSEGALHVTVSIDAGSYGGGPSVIIPPNAFERWDHAGHPNSVEKQTSMRKNFAAAMAFQGITLEP